MDDDLGLDLDPDDVVTAARLLIETRAPGSPDGFGSTSMLQRKMQIGLMLACQLMCRLEQLGIVGQPEGQLRLRPVLVDQDGMDAVLTRIRTGA